MWFNHSNIGWFISADIREKSCNLIKCVQCKRASVHEFHFCVSFVCIEKCLFRYKVIIYGNLARTWSCFFCYCLHFLWIERFSSLLCSAIVSIKSMAAKTTTTTKSTVTFDQCYHPNSENDESNHKLRDCVTVLCVLDLEWREFCVSFLIEFVRTCVGATDKVKCNDTNMLQAVDLMN